MLKNSILIVGQDKEYNNQLIKTLVNEYIIYSTYSEQDALKYIGKGNIDLFILDLEVISDFEKFNKLINDDIDLYSRKTIPIIYIMKEDNLDIEVKLLETGAIDVITKSFNEKLISLKIKKAIQFKVTNDEVLKLVENSTNELNNSRNKIIIAMSILAESRDDLTGEHIFRMREATKILANKYRMLYPDELSEKQMEEIILFSPLHDIGKIPISDSILKKEGILSKEEFNEMQNHARLGGDILEKTQNTIGGSSLFLKVAIEIAMYHHEKFDGTGYPFGLKGEEIPLSARIVKLADVYDALISNRRYKFKFSHEKVMDIILNGDGRISPNDFDPKVLNAFVNSSLEFKKSFEK